MKKMIGIILAVALSGSLMACGSESGSVEVSNDQTSAEEVASTEETTTESGSVEVTVTDTDAASEAAESGQSEEAVPEETSFEEQVLFDNDSCSITLTGMDLDPTGKSTLNLCLENKTTDITLMFASEDAYINGLADNPGFAKDVAPGKKSNCDMTFKSLSEYGVDDYTDIEIAFRVYDNNDWQADEVIDDSVHIYPNGEENAVTYTRTMQDSDSVLLDNDYITLILIDYGEDANDFALNLYFENKTDANVMLAADDCSVNGYMVSPSFATSVGPGKCKYTSMTWRLSKLEENGITDVNNIEFTLRMYDNDNWGSDDFVNENITLNF